MLYVYLVPILSAYRFLIVMSVMSSQWIVCLQYTINPRMCLYLNAYFEINATTKHFFLIVCVSIHFSLNFILNFVSLYLDLTLINSTTLEFKISLWELLVTNRWVQPISNYYRYIIHFCHLILFLFMHYCFYYFILYFHFAWFFSIFLLRIQWV